MSHLEKRQNKQFLQRIVIGIVLFVFVFFFLFTTGIKLLVSFTLFLNQLANGGNKQQTVEKQQTLNSVDIDPIASATNSATIEFTGTSLNFDSLEIYLNDTKQGQMSISDTFAGEVKDLEKGQNTIYFIAKSSSSKTTKKTQTFSVLYKTDKPKLDISSPGDNSKTNKEDIIISGSTDKETSIKINDQPIIVDADGKFTSSVRLKSGENKIVITAEDIVGNQTEKTLTVTYSKDD